MAFPSKPWYGCRAQVLGGGGAKPCLSVFTRSLYSSWSAVRDRILYHSDACLCRRQPWHLKIIFKLDGTWSSTLNWGRSLSLYKISSIRSFNLPSLSLCTLRSLKVIPVNFLPAAPSQRLIILYLKVTKITIFSCMLCTLYSEFSSLWLVMQFFKAQA